MNNAIRDRIYKVKRYPHFDRKVHWRDVYRLIEDPNFTAQHGFYPFIYYEQTSAKYPKKYIAGECQDRDEPKKRCIMYSSHIDRYIYEYYAHLINERYNERVKRDGTNRCAVAYRNALHKNNIHFAKEAFDSIRGLENAYVLIGDFTGYFDNLSHSYLKSMLCSLFEIEQLAPAWYAVFKSITRYSYLELDKIRAHKKLDRKEFGKLDQIFSPEELRDYKKGHLIKNCDNFGIPQGSAISAALSNVYLLEFDKLMNDFITNKRGFYRRYCDDFIVVLPNEGETVFLSQKDVILSIVKSIPNLTLQPQKAQAYAYHDGSIKNCNAHVFPGSPTGKRSISFLGFTFDGKTISIRSKTISKFYNRMYRKADNIVEAGGITKHGNKIPMRKIYTLYSKYGKNIGGAQANKKKKGNFLSYVDRAKRIFSEDKDIDRDTRHAWGKLQRRLHPRDKPTPPNGAF